MERVYPVEKLIFVREFCGFLCSLGVRIADSHVVVGVARKIEMTRDWFERICVVLFCVS